MINSMASMCGGQLASLHSRFKNDLGFVGCHTRELGILQQTDPRFTRNVPAIYGVQKIPNVKRISSLWSYFRICASWIRRMTFRGGLARTLKRPFQDSVNSIVFGAVADELVATLAGTGDDQ